MLGLVKALGAEHGAPESSNLFKFLCRAAEHSFEVAVALFWALKVETERVTKLDAAALLLTLLGKLPPSTCSALLLGQKLISALHHCVYGQEHFSSALLDAKLVHKSANGVFEVVNPIPLPLRPNAMCQEIDLSRVEDTPGAHESAKFGVRVSEPLPSRPTGRDSRQRSGVAVPPPTSDMLSLMYKKEDMANDVVIEDAVRLVDVCQSWSEHPLVHRTDCASCPQQELINADPRVVNHYGTIPLVTYDVMQIGRGAGLVNFVRGAIMVRDIEGGTWRSMKNWVNVESKRFGDSVKFRQNYTRSLAAWIVISSVLLCHPVD